MKLKLYTADGSASQERDYAIPEFEGDKGQQALKQVLLAHMNNRRQGTVSTKTRTTVHGTGKKPFRQKGSGRARQGSMVGPQHYHGAVAFGPQPRDYSQRVNRKMRTLALSRALFNRAGDAGVAVIENWDVSAPKTRLLQAVIERIAPAGKVLAVDASWSDQMILAGRNMERVYLNEARNLNAWDFARYDLILISEQGMACLLNRINSGN
jgi:large subunit ribosomal protein L4